MKTLERLTLVLDPEGRDRGDLSSILARRGHIVATRRNALECLDYVNTFRPALVLLRLAGEGDRLGEAVQRISPRTRVLLQSPAGKWKEARGPEPTREDALRELVDRLLDQEMHERA